MAVVRAANRTVLAVDPVEVVRADGPDGLAVLDRLRTGWWAGMLSYDLGRATEPFQTVTAPDVRIPDVLWARFDARLEIPDGAQSEPVLAGRGPARDRLAELVAHPCRDSDPPPVALGPPRSSLDRPAFEAGVRRILQHLEVGDCYQVNLTRRLEWQRRADPTALFRRLLAANPAPHAALVRLGDIAIVSASPESFLRVDGRTVTTRPIKGTGRDARALAASAKDRAENVMIVDLARNDLGRVCEYGSVSVPALCVPEEHPGLVHLVSTVTGTLRADVGLRDLVAATFPPASVTGCPKPRVLQIIEALEPVRRGPYCGAIGFVDSDAGTVDLNVAIRTFVTTPAGTELGVGAGIVADSDPAAEWQETELKVARLLSAT